MTGDHVEHALAVGERQVVGDSDATVARPKLKRLRIDRLNVPQPAIRTGRRRLAELVASVEQVGILVPLVVRALGGGEHVVIGGAGRLEALRLTGAGPTTLVPCIVVDVDDAEAMLLALVDNVVREEMRPFDEAETARVLVEDYGYEQQRVAAALGVSPATISMKLAVFRLDPKVVAAVRKDRIALRVALSLLPLADDRSAQRRLLKRILTEGLSAAEVKGIVAADRFGDEAVAPLAFELRGAGHVKARTTSSGRIVVTVQAKDRASLTKLLRAAEKKLT